MTRTVIFGTALILLTGCADVRNETYSTITLNGRDYDLRTRTVSGTGNSFVQHSVLAYGTWRTCLPDSPGSCEGAVRQRDRFSDR
jgi:hypothetical protein